MADSQADKSAAWRGFKQKFRLNPCHLPQNICYKGQKSGRYFTAFLTERGVFMQKHDRIHANCAIMPRFAAMPKTRAQQTQGKVLKIFSPQQFQGIAACKISLSAANSGAAAQTAEQKAFCLMLLHEEADYSVPLLISADKNDVLLDWRLWADCYNLPMLTGEYGGGFRPLGSAAALKLFINDSRIYRAARGFSLRCHGLSLNTRLVLANQIMLG